LRSDTGKVRQYLGVLRVGDVDRTEAFVVAGECGTTPEGEIGIAVRVGCARPRTRCTGQQVHVLTAALGTRNIGSWMVVARVIGAAVRSRRGAERGHRDRQRDREKAGSTHVASYRS